MGSDHAPIRCTLKLVNSFSVSNSERSKPIFNFAKADRSQFKISLDLLIENI